MLGHVDGFGQVIQQHRRKQRMAQQALAVILGVSVSAVSQWEREVNVPRRDTASRIDEALHADGEIVAAIGYVAGTDHEERITRLEDEVRRLMESVTDLQRRSAKGARATTPPARRATSTAL